MKGVNKEIETNINCILGKAEHCLDDDVTRYMTHDLLTDALPEELAKTVKWDIQLRLLLDTKFRLRVKWKHGDGTIMPMGVATWRACVDGHSYSANFIPAMEERPLPSHGMFHIETAKREIARIDFVASLGCTYSDHSWPAALTWYWNNDNIDIISKQFCEKCPSLNRKRGVRWSDIYLPFKRQVKNSVDAVCSKEVFRKRPPNNAHCQTGS